MSKFIVIYRPSKNQVDTLENEQGFTKAFDSVADAQEAIDDHAFIEHCEHEILEVNF